MRTLVKSLGKPRDLIRVLIALPAKLESKDTHLIFFKYNALKKDKFWFIRTRAKANVLS